MVGVNVKMNLAELKRHAIPLHAELATLLRNQIYSGAIPAGAQLPPLSELTETLGVARMTVRQAMDTLEDEGLIERHSGRGTFVKPVEIPKRQSLRLETTMSQLQAMVDQLEVSVTVDDGATVETEVGGVIFRRLTRIHTLGGRPFCHVDLLLDRAIHQLAPARFASEIVVSVLNDIGVKVHSARQRVTISHSDVGTSKVLGIKINSPVFRVFREFFGEDGQLIYSANLTYPGDMLEFDIVFSTHHGA